MNRAHLKILGVCFLLISSGFGLSCSKKDEVKPDGEPTAASTTDADLSTGDSDSGQAAGLQTVFFPYDSFELNESAKTTLKANGEILKSKATLNVQIEGHCDQRGGIQYNIALGEKRANSVRKYLMDNGVSGDRLTTISFGKERLLDQGTGEDSWSKNRRANFVITSK